MKELTKLSLFSGILGDDLASEWAGIKTICCVEIDPFCQAVIKKHYPNMPIIGDIHDATKEKVKELTGQERIDIIAGGDPCQPRSVAGKRRGREDDRDLWHDMFKVIQQFKPAWVLNENPTGRLTMDFYEVLSDLESAGYETRSFVIPACAVNAPHRRDRVYIIAHSKHAKTSRQRRNGRGILPVTKSEGLDMATIRLDTNTISQGLEIGLGAETKRGTIRQEWASVSQTYLYEREWNENWLEVATALCGMDDGFPNRVARLKALGNAQVPQQVYPIYKAIADYEMKL